MPDGYVCPDCDISHDGPGVCEGCGKPFVDLSGFDLDDGVKVAKTSDDGDPLSLDDSVVDDREELPEAA